MEPVNEGWATRIAEERGAAIRAADPREQQRMCPGPEKWRRWVKDDDVAWALESYPNGIHRTDLLELAAGDLDDPATQRRVFVTTMLWGVGDGHRMYGRHRTLYASEELPGALADSVRLVREGSLETAFGVMEALPGIMYRFHTKWLWVVGRSLESSPVPLILDNRVWSSLRGLGWPSAPNERVTPARWSAYLHDAGYIAEQLDVTPEHVEYWLFNGAS